MGYEHIPHPNDWTRGPMGNCFHMSLSGWALLRDGGETGWKVALGIVCPKLNGDRHIHAWLQHGERVRFATDGTECDRAQYYEWMGVERASVRLVNPRKLLRSAKKIDRDTIDALLKLSGLRWVATEQGGIVPRD